MTLQQLHYAIVISETGSLNKAAEILYITQPSLSESMRELERELGITIFHRSGRGVSLTNDGLEFITYARQVYHQYEALAEKYGSAGKLKKKFGVSMQHYSFAVESFVEMAQKFNTAEYEFVVRETTTWEVIEDVSTSRSEIGILYLNDFNRRVLTRLFRSNDLEFHKLIDCSIYVYLWKGHPLAKEKSISLQQLDEYPCLSFEQGSSSSFYFAEEVFSTRAYRRTIKVDDRATMLDLMRGLGGYTLCSGILCEELNRGDYKAVPLEMEEEEKDRVMEVGYIMKKNLIPSKMAALYIGEMQRYLEKQGTVRPEE